MTLIRRWPVVLLLGVAAGVVPWALFWNDLPDPLATHWGLGSDADGHSARFPMFVVLTTATVVLAGASALLAIRRNRALGLVWITFVVTGLAVGVSASTVLANRGAATWEDADLNLVMLAVLVVPLVLLGRLGSEMAERNGRSEQDDDHPRIDLQPGEMATWTGTSSARWPWLVAAAVLVTALPLQDAGAVAVVALVASAALVASFASVRVTVGANGVRVRPGLLAWPAVRLPLARIAHAQAIDARPLDWGGWGYRGSLHLFNRAAWLIRGGEGLRVDLTDSKVFLVSVDDAAQAAAVLNGLLQR